jgi:hypothetical protein
MKNGLCLTSVFSVRPGSSLQKSRSVRIKETLNADYPEPIRGNPKLRAEPCPSRLAGNTGLNGDFSLGQIHFRGCTNLHLLASSCTNLHKKNFRSTATQPHPVVFGFWFVFWHGFGLDSLAAP